VSLNELNSPMILIHPPLSIIGFVFTFLFTVSLFIGKRFGGKMTKLTGLSAWTFSLLGLITGMIWAQIAWGSYWSWDPKETLTLIFFLSVSASQMSFFEKNLKLTKGISILSCILSMVTLSSSYILSGLHSFL
jgi:ABC-type transport system involved in cytochrome c biogenesis permease subunit